jgi:hypothetical protein
VAVHEATGGEATVLLDPASGSIWLTKVPPDRNELVGSTSVYFQTETITLSLLRAHRCYLD